MSSPQQNYSCMKSSSSTVICKEIFDEGYQPSNEEIKDYAVKIGIDPEKEPYLLYIARDGLMQALPPNWQICFHESYKAYYYVNRVTKRTQWEHPLDDEFKQLVDKARQKFKTQFGSSGGDDKSEDYDSGIKSLQGTDLDTICDNNLSDTKRMENNRIFLTPIGSSGGGGIGSSSSSLMNSSLSSNNRTVIGKSNNLNAIPLGPPSHIGLKIKTDEPSINKITSPFGPMINRDDKPKGFTLTGTGSMFLKSNTARLVDLNKKEFQDSTVKGILRDSSLGDVRTKGHIPQDIQTNDLEDRKSVRFNFEEKRQIFEKSNSDDDLPGSKKDVSSDAAEKSSDSKSSDGDDDSYDDWDVLEIKPENYVTEVRVGLNNQKPPPPPTATKPTVNRVLSTFGKLNENHGMILPGGGGLSVMGNTSVKPMYEDESVSDSPNSIKLNEKTVNEQKQELESRSNDEKRKFTNQINETLDKLKREHELELKKIIDENKSKLENEKIILETNRKKAVDQLRSDFEQKLESEKREQINGNEKLLDELRANLAEEFEQKRKDIVESHRSAAQILQKNHAEILEELERDLKTEEELLKKDHRMHLSQMKDKLAHEMDVERQRMRETGEDRLYEKIRCEKRLLEDKYQCLKEKYIRLKTDVKMTMERRKDRRKGGTVLNTTGSETDKSNSQQNYRATGSAAVTSAPIDFCRPPPSTPKMTAKFNDRTPSNLPLPPPPPHLNKSPNSSRCGPDPNGESGQEDDHENSKKYGGASLKYFKKLQQTYDDTTSMSQSDTTMSNHYAKLQYTPTNILSDNGNSDSEALKVTRTYNNNNNNNNNSPNTLNNKDGTPGRQRKKIFTRMKSASTSRLNSTNRRDPIDLQRPCTPVENLRRQLQKLEDLEDQFPDNSLDTTYHLRYPFTDVAGPTQHGNKGSSELEFFKHRIHLERDSVRRAKDSLRTQRTNFRARQREIKLRHKSGAARHSLDQLIQEEKELTEMEVNLHRTRALLGEKVIRLRHLEQSLQRVYEKEKPDLIGGHDEIHRLGGGSGSKDDATLSDLSSHSSSGFSSTDFATDSNQINTPTNRNKENPYQESSEIIQSLENLNAEIREIWEILSKQQSHSLTPPPSLFYPDINWGLPTLSQTTQQSALIQHQQPPAIIPTLADRLETYRQLASGRATTTVAGIMTAPAVNTIVSQSPLAGHYTTTLVERTRDLRNWLRQAKNEHEMLSGGNQQADL